MNLIEQAEEDLAFTLEDDEDGFGIDIILSKNGTEYEFKGQSTDIGFLIDPNTGVEVRGRTCEVTIRLSTVISKIGEIPDKTEEGTGWMAKYVNINGDEWQFAIEEAGVDRKLGLVRITLGLLNYGG